ncbi:LegC family aminotransferase [Gallaecimonas xiamenensis]|uniref:4-keto-6-deoxy-N-Acetyl-D-hexosaminyl-(Lipid carrier) aminotransferase n=1 Tax=Gallaecimonas xiamenensis 3-C-1 TaxID=745411 RepID=K2IY67_9GAMM|nr:LegC family aminotransferase [Gallaecimonas xiamenensis]EKE75426.1 4-keto-6-deoxy-N-Acetyl-D-hexosaminyl-(Lipid carrier) aminotransferase [Gallaecimonas xiamenensis 3-C-1]
MHNQLIEFVRDCYQSQDFIPLHAPTFKGNEKAYVLETLDSTFVSSVGAFVGRMEEMLQDYTGAPKAVATVNGTAALHCALYQAGIGPGDLVLTQALTFVATCNALHQLGAEPVFIDIEPVAFGLCPKAAQAWLAEHAELDDQGQCRHKASGKAIKALLPMHTFGHPAQLDELAALGRQWHLSLIEDAAESLGSFYKGRHTGTLGRFGVLSFNGNKVVTTGGGGMVLCQDQKEGEHLKHLTTTAKVPHPFEFVHDEPGFNYRMPNLNAALGCAQLERLDAMLANKRALAGRYQGFFAGSDYRFVEEPGYGRSNYWLNAVLCPDAQSRDALLQATNASGVMTRPVWRLMHKLPMYSQALRGDLSQSEWAEARLVNLPSSPTEASHA